MDRGQLIDGDQLIDRSELTGPQPLLGLTNHPLGFGA
jgi:hypothetical protein